MSQFTCDQCQDTKIIWVHNVYDLDDKGLPKASPQPCDICIPFEVLSSNAN